MICRILLLVVLAVLAIAIVLIGLHRKPYAMAKYHIIAVAAIVYFIVAICVWERFSHFGSMETWTGIADNIASGAVFTVVCIFSWGIEKKIKNKSEDATKLLQDYDKLAEKYSKDKCVKAKNPDGGMVTYPVILVGECDIPIMESFSEAVQIEDYPDRCFELPTIIELNYNEIFSVHDTSNIFNNRNIRVKRMSVKENVLYMETERTTYYNSLVTNRAADYKFAGGLSVRELFEPGPFMTSLEQSKLSNHLGFNGFVESSDGYVVFVKRAGDMSIGKGTYGDSIGASLKLKYALNKKGEFDYAGLRNAIICEIGDELKIKENALEKMSVFATYRDCVECGKPQLLFYARAKETAAEISETFMKELKTENSRKTTKKLDKKQRQEIKARTDGTELIWIDRKTITDGIAYTSDGINVVGEWGAFYCFKGNEKTVSPIKHLDMVPSASAAVFLLKEYLTR